LTTIRAPSSKDDVRVRNPDVHRIRISVCLGLVSRLARKEPLMVGIRPPLTALSDGMLDNTHAPFACTMPAPRKEELEHVATPHLLTAEMPS
jgi:hypothetical protein